MNQRKPRPSSETITYARFSWRALVYVIFKQKRSPRSGAWPMDRNTRELTSSNLCPAFDDKRTPRSENCRIGSQGLAQKRKACISAFLFRGFSSTGQHVAPDSGSEHLLHLQPHALSYQRHGILNVHGSYRYQLPVREFRTLP